MKDAFERLINIIENIANLLELINERLCRIEAQINPSNYHYEWDWEEDDQC